MAEDTKPLAEGTAIDHFVVIRPLGRGGMGEVYLARDTKLGRRVALKLIRSEMLEEERMKERFLYEARATAQFNHQHIVTVYEVGEHEGRPYLALELLDGQNLRERLKERETTSTSRRAGLGVPEAARFGAAIADALAAAHDVGILHRDLKPPNVVIPSDGRLRVVDFGLAIDVLGTALPDGPTDEATTGGTPAYMAPEQWRGIECTPATDVWALGVMLFELCTGRRPYEERSEHAQSLVVCSSAPAPNVSEFGRVPAEMSELIRRCLEKSPSKRPAATEVREALREMLHPQRVKRTGDASPFRGLMPFSVDHGDTFFGRDTEIAAFVERARLQPVLPVVGPSGAGKSSFVQAGVIPRLLEQERWLVLALRPSARPFRALAAVLERVRPPPSADEDTEAVGSTRPDTRAARSAEGPTNDVAEEKTALHEELLAAPRLLSMKLRELAADRATPVLLFVDQLEELFTMVDDADVRRAFLEGICTAADDASDPIRVVFTIRHDFLDRLAESSEAREILSGVIVVQRPSSDALRQILVRPVEEIGYRYSDPGLVDEMISSVAGEPACLPLLQFAAQQLWEGRDRGEKLLLRSVYERIGGVEGALATRADGVLDGFTPSEILVARQLLMRMVTPDRTRKTVAERAALEGLGEAADDVLARLVGARLISVAQTDEGAQLELAHESLIRNWTTLAHWLDAGDDELAFLAEIGQASELWDRRGRPDDGLWRREPLAEALAKVATSTSPVPALVQRFLEAGREAERTRRRRVRFVAVGTLLVLGVLSVVFWVQRREADTQRARAEQRERLAEARRGEALLEGAREAYVSGRMLEARAKLRTAFEVADAPLARTLWWQLGRRALRWRTRLGATVYGVSFSPDGRSVAVACQDRAVHVFDMRTGRTRAFRGHDDQVFAVAFSPDGSSLASATWSGEVRLWDVASGESTRMATRHEDKVSALTFSPDGAHLASASWDHDVRIWEVASGRVEHVLSGHGQPVETVAFSPDGVTLASGGRDGVVRFWDVRTGRVGREIAGLGGAIYGVRFAPAGQWIASGGADGQVRLFDVSSGRLTREIEGWGEELRAIAVSPNGEVVAAAGWDGVIRLWDVDSGETMRTLRGHEASVRGIDFSADGQHLVSGGMDWNVMLWAVDVAEQERLETGHASAVYDVAFSPDGQRVASAGKDESVRIWDVATARQERTFVGHSGEVRSVTFSPDGALLASGSNDHDVRVWDASSGRQLRVLAGHAGPVRGLSFSPDGVRLASSSYDGTVRLWDVASGATAHVLREHEGEVLAVRFSPDGSTLATGSFDRTARIWDSTSGRALRTLSGHRDAVLGVAFSPDGARLASASWDRSVRSWDLASGALLDELGPLRGRAWALGNHPDGERVVVALSDGTAQVWRWGQDAPVELRGRAQTDAVAAFSPDGRSVVTSSDEGVVQLWDARSGRPIWRAPLLLLRPGDDGPLMLSHLGWTTLAGEDEPPPATRWSSAVETQARFASTGANAEVSCMLTHDGRLEMWDLRSDHRVAGSSDLPIDRVLAVPGGCLSRTLAEDEVPARVVLRRLGEDAARDLDFAGDAHAFGGNEEELLVVAGERVFVFDAEGHQRASHAAGPGATAVTRVDDEWLAVGYRDGHLQLVPTDPALTAPTHDFERVRASPVLHIVVGPMRTLLVGHADGAVALYDRSDGKRLEHARVHGPVEHLLFDGERAYAVSGLGDALAWNLETLSADRCDLLREIWAHVPVVWEGGRPLEREAPSGHPCTR